jgi:predicted phage terminase large subunit-like protein
MIISDQDINTLKVAKVKCLQSQLFHTRYFFKQKFNRKFVVGDHHHAICDALDRVIRGECKRLIINIAPRYTKTELAVKHLIPRGLAINPAAKFIHLSYSDTLALDNSEEAKENILLPAYQQMFPNVQLKKDSTAKNKWYTTAGGGVYATAAAGQVTGFGAGKVDVEDKEDPELNEFLTDIDKIQGFGGAIIIDDPIKPEDADSEIKRERVNQRFDSTIRNRVNSRNTPIIVIMQRLHPSDLSGYLLRDEEQDHWEVVSLPAIKTDGTALWPFKHTIDELKAMKAANDIVFERQYMQNPKPKEGLLFPEEDLHFFDPNTVDVSKMVEFKFGVIDPADEGGDDLSFPTGYLVGNKIYIPHVIYNTHGTDVNEPACVDHISKEKLNAVNIEGNSAWILFAKSVRTKVHERYDACEIRVIKNSTNKHTRILAQSSFIKNNFIFRSDYKDHPQYMRFMQNLTSYMRVQSGTTRNKHEDAPDSCAEMASYFQKQFAHLW